MLTPDKLWGIYDVTKAEILSVHVYETLATDARTKLYLKATVNECKDQRYVKGTLSECIDWYSQDHRKSGCNFCLGMGGD